MSTATLQPGALAYTRLTDATHVLYGAAGVEAVLFWAESTTGLDTAGEPQVYPAAWWVTFTDTPTLRQRVDEAPPWDAAALDAECEQVIAEARACAAALVAHHRQETGEQSSGP